MRPLRELADALRVDLQWIREHTRLSELATRWDGRGRPESLLLRGDEIDAAKKWMAARNAAAPCNHRRAARLCHGQRGGGGQAAGEGACATRGHRQGARCNRAATERAARLQRRIWWLLGGVAALVLAMVGYVTWQSYDVARREINVFTARAAEALNDEKFDLAMRYALQAYPARGQLPWTTPFSTELEAKLAGGALATRLHRLLKGHSQPIYSAAFRGDGKQILTASVDNTARIWDAESGDELVVLQGHGGIVNSAAFSNDGTRVVTASWDQTARIWDVDSGRSNATLKGHTNAVHNAAFSGDGKRVLTTAFDGTARIWDLESGRSAVLEPGNIVNSATFSSDGKRAVTAVIDGTARIWDAGSGGELVVLRGHAGIVNSAAFTSDGRRVVTASNDNTARIWDAENGNEYAVLRGHRGGVDSAAFSGDGKRVVTASDDTTARVWDVESGSELVVLQGHTGRVNSAAATTASGW